MTRFGVVHGDCMDVMARMPANTVDSIVTDPPYGLEFAGKDWDHGVPGVEFWREALRVAKPGAHLVAFGGTRTFHRLATSIEDAGWELRDTLMWLYGTGFPHSLDVARSIESVLAGSGGRYSGRDPGLTTEEGLLEAPGKLWDDAARRTMREGSDAWSGNRVVVKSAEAAAWEGWGTALKPAWEPIILARKPLAGTVASNVLAHGTGALHVDACRVPTTDSLGGGWGNLSTATSTDSEFDRPWMHDDAAREAYAARAKDKTDKAEALGRWPANLLHDGSDEVTSMFPGVGEKSASRFFYSAKASAQDKNEGVEGRNTHPTVKPTALMRWCVRLVTPPGGLVLDPFAGSCSTGKAALLEGFNAMMIEQDSRYAEIGKARMEDAVKKGTP